MSELKEVEGSREMGYVGTAKPEEKTIIDQVFEWFHNFWYGQPEQKQHEGTSTTDEAGETAEIPKGGGTDETITASTDEAQVELEVESKPTVSLPKDRGLDVI